MEGPARQDCSGGCAEAPCGCHQGESTDFRSASSSPLPAGPSTHLLGTRPRKPLPPRRGENPENRRFHDKWRRLLAEGKSPQKELMRPRPQRSKDELECLQTLTQAPFSAVVEYQTDGSVIFCVPAGMRWLKGEHCRLNTELGEPLVRPSEHKVLTDGPFGGKSGKRWRARAGGPSEGDGRDDIVHSSWSEVPYVGPCGERREVVLRFGDTDLANFILTGHSTLPDVDGVSNVDLQVMAYLYTLNLPNASVGITDGGGRLRHARGYTFREWFDDPEELYLACPSTLYRIASLTKPITAMAIQRLISEGFLDRTGAPTTLETPFRNLLSDEVRDRVPSTITYCPVSDLFPCIQWDLDSIRLVDLLTHQAGWCESDTSCSDSGDGWDSSSGLLLMTHDIEIYETFPDSSIGVHFPIDPQNYTEFAFSGYGFPGTNQYKWVAPGSRYAYSNFGYLLLGRVIEYATTASNWTGWYDALKTLVLDPLGMTATIQARTAFADRAIGEVKYATDVDRFEPYPPVLTDFGYELATYDGTDHSDAFLDQSYGGRVHIEALQSGGGIVSNVVDYCKFLTNQRMFDYGYDPAVDDPTGRLWRVLDWEGTLDFRRGTNLSVISRAPGWFLDQSYEGRVQGDGSGGGGGGMGGGLGGKVMLNAAVHGGNWPGMNATAFLFPPISSSIWSNVGIVCMLNRDIATAGREDADPSADAYVPTQLANLLAVQVAALSSLGTTIDLFDRF